MPAKKKKVTRRRRVARSTPRVKTPPILFEKTQSVIRRIQQKVDGTFFSYWTSTSGSVCDNDVLAMHAILKAAGPQQPQRGRAGRNR